MRTRGSILAVLLSGLVVASLAFAAPAIAKTIDVFPGQSIQSAVNAASPGDTVFVHAGVYHQSVVVGKDHIWLRGAGQGRTVLLPVPNANPNGPEGNGISIGKFNLKTGQPSGTSFGVHVSGFTIKGFDSFGVFFLQADGLLVSHVTAVNNADYGISGFGLHDGTFKSNVAIGSNEAGFYVGDSPHANFGIYGNVARGNRVGFLLRDASHGFVHENRAVGNCMGLLVLNTNSPGPADQWIIRKNHVMKNTKYCPGSKEEHSPPFSGTGIGVAGGTHVLVGLNTITGNRPSGPSPLSGGVTLVSAKPFGGSVETDNLVRYNTFSGNKPDIKWDGQGANSFHHNKCTTSRPGGLCSA
jgi:nitrous oxidase accessory protein NosD